MLAFPYYPYGLGGHCLCKGAAIDHQPLHRRIQSLLPSTVAVRDQAPLFGQADAMTTYSRRGEGLGGEGLEVNPATELLVDRFNRGHEQREDLDLRVTLVNTDPRKVSPRDLAETPATYVQASVEESFRQSQFPDTLGTKLQFNYSAFWYNEKLMASALTNPLGLAPEL